MSDGSGISYGETPSKEKPKIKLSRTYRFIMFYIISAFIMLYIAGPVSTLLGYYSISNYISKTSMIIVGVIGVVLTSYFLKEKSKMDNVEGGYAEINWIKVGKTVVTFCVFIGIISIIYGGIVIAFFDKSGVLADYVVKTGLALITLIAEVLSIFVQHKVFRYKYGDFEMDDVVFKYEKTENKGDSGEVEYVSNGSKKQVKKSKGKQAEEDETDKAYDKYTQIALSSLEKIKGDK